jgi:hypothetical protein
MKHVNHPMVIASFEEKQQSSSKAAMVELKANPSL